MQTTFISKRSRNTTKTSNKTCDVLLQTYLSTGNLFPPCSDIREATSLFGFGPENTIASNTVEFKSTSYKRVLFVAIGHKDDGFVFGRTELILVHKGAKIFFARQNVSLNPQ